MAFNALPLPSSLENVGRIVIFVSYAARPFRLNPHSYSFTNFRDSWHKDRIIRLLSRIRHVRTSLANVALTRQFPVYNFNSLNFDIQESNHIARNQFHNYLLPRSFTCASPSIAVNCRRGRRELPFSHIILPSATELSPFGCNSVNATIM